MPIIPLDQVSDKSFDYIIVGGGTSGLTLAARLTEDPNVSVLVLEAGGENLDDPALIYPGQHGSQFGNPVYDWFFKTVPQKYSSNSEFFWPRGRTLGGSSAINFLCWTLPPKEDFDDWEKLGNKGWNWDNLWKYSQKAASFGPLPIEERERRGPDFSDGWDKPIGYGPVKISHPKVMIDVDLGARETLHKLGIPKAPLPMHGNPNGTFICPNTVDVATNYRSFSGRAHYAPNANRPNFVVLTLAYVNRVVTSTADGELVANGVEFTHGEDGTVHVAHAKKEVILSAGTLKTPHILELSGIGQPEVLRKIGVPVKVAIDGVGENAQEHFWVGVTFELKDGVKDETFDLLRVPGVAEKQAELIAQGKGIFSMGVVNVAFQTLSTMSDNAAEVHKKARTEIEQDIKDGKLSAGLAEQYRLQLERLERDAPVLEFIGFPGFLSFPRPPLPGKKYYTWIVATNHSFSRGNVHATSNDPKIQPAIDPHYFERDIDLQSIVEMVRFARKTARTAPLKDFLDDEPVELNPGNDLQTDEEIREWVKKVVCTTYHTMGTSSMLPREKGGVVDERLKVYGTKNLRVVDLSIVPLIISSHTQSAAYIIAEKAADIILGRI